MQLCFGKLAGKGCYGRVCSMANLPCGGFRDAESIGDIARWLASLKREEDFPVIVGDRSVEKDMRTRRLVASFRPLPVEEP